MEKGAGRTSSSLDRRRPSWATLPAPSIGDRGHCSYELAQRLAGSASWLYPRGSDKLDKDKHTTVFIKTAMAMAGVLWLVRPAPLFVMFLLWNYGYSSLLTQRINQPEWCCFTPRSCSRMYTCTGCVKIRCVANHLARTHDLGARIPLTPSVHTKYNNQPRKDLSSPLKSTPITCRAKDQKKY